MPRYTKHGRGIQTKAEKRRRAAKTNRAKISRLEEDDPLLGFDPEDEGMKWTDESAR